MTRLGYIRILFVLWIAGLLATPGQAQLYGLAGGPSSIAIFYSIDPATGTATEIGPTGFERCSAMDFGPSGILYATCERPGTPTPIAPPQAPAEHAAAHGAADRSTVRAEEGPFLGDVLIRIDPATGLGTEIGETGCNNTVPGMSIRSSDGLIFASCFYRNPPPGGPDPFQFGLVTIDPATGATTPIGQFSAAPFFGNGGGNGLAFAADGTLYLAASTTSSIHEYYEVDTTTGVATLAGNLVYDYDGERPKALDAQPGSGTIYAITRTGDDEPSREVLAILDETTGQVTLIGPTTDRMDGLAWQPPAAPTLLEIPTLSPAGLSVLLLLLVASAILLLRRRIERETRL